MRSKYTLAILIQQQEVETVAKALIQAVVLKLRNPQIILTDQGSNCSVICLLKCAIFLKLQLHIAPSNGAFEWILVDYIMVDVLFWRTQPTGVNGYHIPLLCLI
jgi:hypothetical protein